ncbi:MAG: hypothetical protein A2840_00025 [Candidatus Buchananbacteria bacterium RIFCSPHIGHO2_01_FULL_47_11b]|uniref:PNPLA domain-containing protein n=1 Tax=Candidatus Buchananbacteria bacterium RIFCSPHIGHO2_01_FULL_47_11b TaxID=1797537 RepID=A0A1G1Y5P2_9BACT|nr:MAG: hypothetical protein A2840_00025 [Candidatus Buchananbacteria bacterium RIFCSPHIGHO2_01_FULL_47_11b]
MNQGQKKKVGLALSGGFIRATAQIGVIEVLEENHIQIDIVSGCSSGSAVAAAYAAGTLPQMKERLTNGRWWEYWHVIFEPTIPRQGFLKGERNRRFFAEFVGDKQFSELNKKLLITATDLQTMHEVILTEGSVSQAIQASTTVPGVFVPVRWGDSLLADGANFNLIPSRTLYESGAEYVIAIDVSQPPNIFTRFLANAKRLLRRQDTIKKYGPKTVREMHIVELVRRAAALSSSQIHNFYNEAYPHDLLIRPDVTGVKRWHVSLVNYCLQQGRIAAEAALPQLKKDLGL